MLYLVPSKGQAFQRDTKSLFTDCLSTGFQVGLVINRPNQCPGVDVEQGTAGASIQVGMTVAHAQ